MDDKSGTAGRIRMRFLAVSAVAFLVDVALALGLMSWLHWSVTPAAAVAYLLTALIFYFVHEYWSFARKGSRADAGRLVRNLAANAVAFVIRIGVIAGLERLYEPGEQVLLVSLYIGAGAAASVAVNYLLNRFWVFTNTEAH
ncbi:MAG TPA: GtrA family protein [Hyphomonadaceae bacterium]|nr:GtrA family protein [Hyphomonadaceae bacterium]